MRIGTLNGLAQIVGVLLVYGIGKNSSFSLAPWRILFLICGALTTAWFLTTRERQAAAMRLPKDHEGGDKTSWPNKQLLEALMDVKSWLIFSFGVQIFLI